MAGKAKSNGKKAVRFGFIDRSGRFVIPARYEDAGAFSEGLAPVKVEGKWGYIDREGKVVIAPAYTRAGRFSNGFALADTGTQSRVQKGVLVNPTTRDGIDEWRIDREGKRHQGWTGSYVDGIAKICLGGFRPPGKPPQDGKWGLVELSGRYVLEPEVRGSVWGHTPVGDLSEGLAPVCLAGGDNPRWVFVDRAGARVTPELEYAELEGFSQGRALVMRKGGIWGFVDKTGAAVGELKWQRAFGYSEGLARVQEQDRQGFVGLDGRLAIPCQFSLAGDFHCGRALAQPAPGKHEMGYIDPTGRTICEPRYSYAKEFREDRAVVGVGGPMDARFGLLDPEGKEVVPLRFSVLRDLENGGARCKVDGKWGYLGKDGAFLIEPRYDQIGGYADEVAVSAGADRSGAGGKWGFVDRCGKELVPPTFDDVRSRFFEGLAAVGVLG